MSTPKPITALNGRTLYIEYEGVEYYPMTYFEERTCTFSAGHDGNNTEKQELPRCSACGEEVDGAMCDMYEYLGGGIVLEYPYRYCPNCGARVEE